MRLHSIRHVNFEGIGRIENWANKNSISLTKTKVYENEEFPALDDFDFLAIMGGPMGVYEKEEHPWIEKEIEFIKEAISKGKKIIGICLGAQLIAEALGAKVYAGPQKEIGWHKIQMTEAGKESGLFKNFPDEFHTLQWHGDTFELPENVSLLMKGDNYKHQAFSSGANVIALQFHLEFCEKCVERLAKECGGEKGEWVQSENEILARKGDFLATEKLLESFLDEFLLG